MMIFLVINTISLDIACISAVDWRDGLLFRQLVQLVKYLWVALYAQVSGLGP